MPIGIQRYSKKQAIAYHILEYHELNKKTSGNIYKLFLYILPHFKIKNSYSTFLSASLFDTLDTFLICSSATTA